MAPKDPSAWNAVDKLMFNWISPMVWRARKDHLTLESLPLPASHTSDAAHATFSEAWDAHLQIRRAPPAAGATPRRPSLLHVLWSQYWRDVLVAGIFKAGWSVLVIFGAYFFVRSILIYVTGAPPFDAVWKGWLLTAFFWLDAWLLGICLQRTGFACLNMGIRVRAALTAAVATKCLNMGHMSKELAAEAVAFVASDVNKIFEGIQEIHYLWTAPFEALAILVLLAALVGVYSLPAFGVLALVVPAQYFFGFCIIRNKIANATHTHTRCSIVQELLPAMKLVKLYAWERFFMHRLNKVRSMEMRLMLWTMGIKVLNSAMVFIVPPIGVLVVLLSQEFDTGKRVTATVSFVVLSLFNILRFPLVVLPKAMRAVTEAYAALQSIEHFLLQESVPKQDVQGEPGVSMEAAVFRHVGAASEDAFCLSVPRFEVKPGQLVGVVGRVGAGKSSLLHAVLGNMTAVEGSSTAGGRIAYVPQNPWCQNLTIKDSILFGNLEDAGRYTRVLHACALELDLSILPLGDQSKVGLRGINLSGGQRQRLNLARCAYTDSDLVLLDGALSAVDHHTAQHIFEHCVRGLLRDKAVILVTHQTEFLPHCDNVAIMDDGACVYFGPWDVHAQQLLAAYLPVSHVLATAGAVEQRRDPSPAPTAAPLKDVPASCVTKGADVHSASVPLMRAAYEYVMQGGWWMVPLCAVLFACAQATRQVSDYWVRWWTANQYKAYDGRYGLEGTPFYVLVYGMLILLFLVLLLSRAAALYGFALRAANGFFTKSVQRVLYAPLAFFLTTPVGDLLVTFTKDQDVLDEALPDALLYAVIYCILLTATTITVSTTIRFFAPLVAGLVVVTATMLALYLPATRQLKKLRSDTKGALVGLVAESLDGLQVIQAFDRQAHFLREAAARTDANHRAVYACECLNLWLAFWCDCYGAVMVLAVACFAVAQRGDLGANAVGLAFSNTIQMLVFYTWTVRLIAESVGHFSATEKLAYFANHVPQEGTSFLHVTQTEAAETAALTGKPPPLNKPSAGASLAITAVATTAQAPADASAVDPTSPGGWSLAVVTDPLPEGPVGPLQGAPSLETMSYLNDGAGQPAWPTSGTVQFVEAWMKYAPAAPYALRGVSFSIAHSEKVGVVGRTGSGKSTLLLALYRMFDLEQGRIMVDGVDIAGLPLRRLRRGLSIIPQEPVVFAGTVRTNLDPFRQQSDMRLWEVLRAVRLDATVSALGGLDAAIDGTGQQAWSLGEQQLVCLARAALKKVPVLCLDEATAAMDPATEAAVVDIINRLFAERTTITIAHRLDTVIRADKVMVLDCGELREFASPSTLLTQAGSMFGALVDRMGPTAAVSMRELAAAADVQRVRRALPPLKLPSSDDDEAAFADAASVVTSARSLPGSHPVQTTTEE